MICVRTGLLVVVVVVLVVLVPISRDKKVVALSSISTGEGGDGCGVLLMDAVEMEVLDSLFFLGGMTP